MSKEIFEALRLLEAERSIPMDFMMEKIQKAIVTACKNSYDGNEEAIININEEEGKFEVSLMKEVVDEVEVKGRQISLSEARKIDPEVSVGEKVAFKLDTRDFGRIAAQTARNIIRQGIRDGEKSQIAQEFQDKQGQIVSAVVERIDPVNGALTLRIGKAESMLPASERIGISEVREGDRIKVYVVEVKEADKGPRVMISRSNPDFIRKLFEMEVPELVNGEVEIRSISREAGSRAKIAVSSIDDNIDPIGACIGNHGARVNIVVDELGGEKIDIVRYSDKPEEFIRDSLLPAKVIGVNVTSNENRECTVLVPSGQLSLAIGNKGQNVRLAARLTGWKIDIKAES